MQNFAVHFLLAVLLFFVVNWIGGHAISAGYHQLTIFGQIDEAPAFNTLFRLLAPTVFLLITAAGWYALGLDVFVRDYWRISLYYVGFRWFFNVVLGRFTLMNWKRQLLLGFLTIGVSYVVYEKLIQYRTNLLPDPQNLANEVWLIVLLFLYHTWNRIERSSIQAGSEARRRKYIQQKFNRIRLRLGKVVQENTDLRLVEALSFAVMVYEQFNRPPVYQWMERHVLFPLGRSRTIGPMQVRVEEVLKDEDSVAVGVRKLQRDYEQAVETAYSTSRIRNATSDAAAPAIDAQPATVLSVEERLKALPYYPRVLLRRDALQRYNIRSDYPSEVDSVFSVIADKYYPDLLEHDAGLG